MKKRQTFYFELDALVDTRYGLLVKEYSERVNVVDINAYRDRKTSYVWEYFGVEKEAWLEKWNKRTVDVLKWSAPTEMFIRINELFITPLAGAATNPVYEKPEMILNTWPYEFDKEQCYELIDAMHEVLLDEIPIDIVFLSPAEVTPTWIANRCESLVLFNFYDWFTAQAGALPGNPLPRTTMHFPALINEGREDDTALVKRGITTAFTELQIGLAEYISLRAIDPHLYSLPPPP